MTSHSPNRAVRSGPYLFEPRVFLRDFPHRAVDFLTGELCLSLHDEEEKAKLERTSPPVRLSLTQKIQQNTAQARGNVRYTLLPSQVFRIIFTVWEWKPTAS